MEHGDSLINFSTNQLIRIRKKPRIPDTGKLAAVVTAAAVVGAAVAVVVSGAIT